METDIDFKSGEFVTGSSIVVNDSYSYLSNNYFYALATAPYYNFYYNFVRRNAQWYDSYVPEFHSAENGIFSTGLAHSLVDGICNIIVGSDTKLKNSGKEIDKAIANSSLQSAYKWADEACFTSELRKAVKYAGALGTSLMKLNMKQGKLWLESLRMDDFFFRTGFTGELEDVTCLIKSYTDTTNDKMRSIRKQMNDKTDYSGDLSRKYYLVERRYFEEEQKQVDEIDEDGTVRKVIKAIKVPYVIYEVQQYDGSITQGWSYSFQKTLSWKDNIPAYIKKLILRDYSAVKIGVPQRLPFNESLGCVLLKYNGGDGRLSQQPFGQSILADIRSYLLGYDLQYSYFIRDLYQGKGTIFMAKELMTNPMGSGALSGYDESLYTLVQQLNDRDNKLPIDKVQFDLRVADWREARNLIYESIATHLNISPSSIASFLNDNTARTAREVATESVATDNYIEIQRGCLSPEIDKLLKVVCDFYGWADDIQIRWAKAGSSNLDTIIDRIIKLKQAELITPYEALKMYMVDADESQLQEAYERLMAYNEEQQKARQQSMEFGFNDLGDIGGNNPLSLEEKEGI